MRQKCGVRKVQRREGVEKKRGNSGGGVHTPPKAAGMEGPTKGPKESKCKPTLRSRLCDHLPRRT